MLQWTCESRSSDTGPQTFEAEDEVATELDEPPEQGTKLEFSKLSRPGEEDHTRGQKLTLSPHSHKASLLTQALLTSPDLTAMSDSDAPLLTSDGGITSPAETLTPSPPLPTDAHSGLALFGNRTVPPACVDKMHEAYQSRHNSSTQDRQKANVEETLGRKRCITFACSRKDPPAGTKLSVEDGLAGPKFTSSPEISPQRRPCILRFACPMKPSRTQDAGADIPMGSALPNVRQTTRAPPPSQQMPTKIAHTFGAMEPTKRQVSLNEQTQAAPSSLHQAQKPFNRVDFQKSEATRFHEFAGPYQDDDEWTHEQTAYKQKMTIDDTLVKENTFRRLAEEAEEEAMEEVGDIENDDQASDQDDDADSTSNDDNDINAASDDGNESDDEGGFAGSEANSDESDDDLSYNFWTPGMTTAATSMEHLDHIKPLTERVASDSSIESIKREAASEPCEGASKQRVRLHHRSRVTKLHHGGSQSKTEDFIIGTLDEDRPLQEAYLSSLEERKRSRQKLIPQDIDPSFPTSDPEADDDGNESEDEDTDTGLDKRTGTKVVALTSSATAESEDGPVHLFRKRDRTPAPSSKRAHTPPPRRLFGQASRCLRSPPPPTRRLTSPPPSRRPSPSAGSPKTSTRHLVVPHLAHRPNLTRTASLPRSENPFWNQHHPRNPLESHTVVESRGTHTIAGADAEYHNRGPVDIVLGLEHKRQRRREKFWRMHCQKAHAGKEKERKCQPGRGAQRMKEVGILMQDRFRGYGHNRPQLMLSI